MFNFASERGIIDFSPLMGMKRPEEKARARVLTNEEIKTFWNCLDLERSDIDIYHLTKLALKTILLTGQRPGEVASMTWKEIDGDWWVIPPEKRKNKEENCVPILPMMTEILDQAKIYSSDSQYVFTSSYNRDKPITVRALSNALRRHRAEMGVSDAYTPHDLRRTLRTRLAKLKVSDIVAERVLGHKLQGVLAIYNRYDYKVEKRQALALWERKLGQILGLSKPIKNVIPFVRQSIEAE